MSGENGQPSAGVDRLRQEFFRAVSNSVRHAKRSLLDYLDFQAEQLPSDARNAHQVIEFMKRRIHNDLSIIESQVAAVFEIYCSGGKIPPFGRSQEELDAAGIGHRPDAKR